MLDLRHLIPYSAFLRRIRQQRCIGIHRVPCAGRRVISQHIHIGFASVCGKAFLYVLRQRPVEFLRLILRFICIDSIRKDALFPRKISIGTEFRYRIAVIVMLPALRIPAKPARRNAACTFYVHHCPKDLRTCGRFAWTFFLLPHSSASTSK